MGKLVFEPNSDHAQQIDIERDTLTVGEAADNHVCVRGAGVAEHHVRFERRGGKVFVVDLGSGVGTVVDGKPVDRVALRHRSLVQVGDLQILYLEDAIPAVPVVRESSAVTVAREESTAVVAREVACPNCGSSLPRSATICPHCGMMLPQGGGSGVPAPSDVYLRPAPLARGVGILPMLSFFFGLFGPLILGIGWLLGIIFGFITLSLIRQRGGFMRDRRYSIWGIGLGFTWLAVLVVAGVAWFYHREAIRTNALIENTIRQNEADVAYLIKEIAVTEEFLKSSRAVPLENDGSGYATLKQLEGLPNPFLPHDTFGQQAKGYFFTVKAHWGDDFTASAVPLEYGVTGRKTFSIDQTGILRGADIGGKQPWEYNAVLPELEMGRSVYIEARERIARELLVEAKRMAEEGMFDRSQFILKELQKKYVLTETFKNFENVAKGIEQLVINAASREGLDQANALLTENKRADALAKFKQVAAAYPSAVHIDEIKGKISTLESQIAAERNQAAQAKWNQAVQLDKEGKADEALAAYRVFASQFGDTSFLQGQKGHLDAALARIEETKASALFAQLTALDIRSNATQVVSLASQLQGSYPHAPTVKNNITMLQGLQQQGSAFVSAQEGLTFFGEQKFADAVTRLEQAVKLNPSLVKEVTPALEVCYFQVGESLFEANKMVEAAASYEKFLNLTPNPEKLDRSKLKQIYLSVGELHFLNKNYTNAAVYLKRGVEFFGDEPKYYRMYGQTMLRQKKYNDALPAYQSLVALAKDDPQARFERGLSWLGASVELQTNVITALTAAASSTNPVIAAPEQRMTTMGQYVLPSTVTDRKLKAEEIQVLKDKQIELRLTDTLERLKSYNAQTPEATIIREAVRLVNEIQAASIELDDLMKDAKTDISKGKVSRARTQLLSVYSTQQDYFDKIISDKMTLKQDLLAKTERLKTALEASANDLGAAATIEAYRGALADMKDPLKKKIELFNAGYTSIKPALETEIKALEEARTLIKLAVSQFKGWAIGWNLNERIEKFFLLNYSEISDKRASGEQLIKRSIAIEVPFEKHIGA